MYSGLTRPHPGPACRICDLKQRTWLEGQPGCCGRPRGRVRAGWLSPGVCLQPAQRWAAPRELLVTDGEIKAWRGAGMSVWGLWSPGHPLHPPSREPICAP